MAEWSGAMKLDEKDLLEQLSLVRVKSCESSLTVDSLGSVTRVSLYRSPK